MGDAMTLHEAMVEVLRGRGWLELRIVAAEVDDRGLYSRKDGQALPTNQVSARARKYPHLFEVTSDGSGMVRLKP